jgi:hypothetical protein
MTARPAALTAARRAAAPLALAIAGAAPEAAAQAPAGPSAPAEATAAAPAGGAPGSEPAVLEASEAHLEPAGPRRGVAVSLGLGGALTVGVGLDGATGRGGAGVLRISHVANARALVALELSFSALFFEYGSTLYRTDTAHALIAAQWYVHPALWVRGGLGAGRYAGDDLVMGGLVLRERVRLAGPAAAVGGGVDIVRLRRLRGGLELSSTLLVTGDGVLATNALLLAATID